jgi:hypothetical protein
MTQETMTDKEAKIKKAFQIIYDYKQEAKEANQSANETFKSLAEEIGGADHKRALKELKVAFNVWVKETEGDTSISEGVKIAESLM